MFKLGRFFKPLIKSFPRASVKTGGDFFRTNINEQANGSNLSAAQGETIFSVAAALCHQFRLFELHFFTIFLSLGGDFCGSVDRRFGRGRVHTYFRARVRVATACGQARSGEPCAGAGHHRVGSGWLAAFLGLV
jgi:hypothetical protein